MTELMGVLHADPSTASVRFERHYATDIADLWSALTAPERVARWFAPVTGEFRVGGTVDVHFDDHDNVYEVRTCEPPSVLVVHWVHDDGRSLVRAQLTATPDGSRLVLDHTGLTAEKVPGYGAGWHWHLDALGAVLAGEEPGSWSTFDDLLVSYRKEAEALVG